MVDDEFANEHGLGEVELPISPEAGIPPALLHMLEIFALVDDPDLGMSRIEALEAILAVWDDLETTDSSQDWADAAQGKVIHVSYDDEGQLSAHLVSSEFDASDVPAALLDALSRGVLRQPSRTRVVVESSIRELLGAWMMCYADEEKLLGHLLIAHDGGPELVSETYDEHVRTHAEVHRGSRPKSRKAADRE